MEKSNVGCCFGVDTDFKTGQSKVRLKVVNMVSACQGRKIQGKRNKVNNHVELMMMIYHMYSHIRNV